MRVLVVEDETDLGEVFRDFLSELGHQSVLVRSAEAALGTARLLLAHPVDRVRLEEHQHVVEPVERDRLADEIEGAQAQAFPCLALRRDAGDSDDRQARLADRPQLEKIQAAHAGQVDVEDDRVRTV